MQREPKSAIGRRFTPIPGEAELASLCVGAAAALSGVSSKDIAGPRRGRASAAQARHLAVYLLHVAFGASLSSCGRVFFRDRASIRHACARIEDARDDAGFDLAVSRLELALPVQRDMLRALADAFATVRICIGDEP